MDHGHGLTRIKADYKKHNPEGHWFDQETLRFWGTEFVEEVYTTPNDGTRAYFVTEEDNFERTARLYSIRAYDFPSHTLQTISFQQDAEKLSAISRAKFLAGV